jgi:ribosomal protein S20
MHTPLSLGYRKNDYLESVIQDNQDLINKYFHSDFRELINIANAEFKAEDKENLIVLFNHYNSQLIF